MKHQRLRVLVPYAYIAPAFTVIFAFSFFSMGISLNASFHNFDAFAGASDFVGLDNYRRTLFASLSVHAAELDGRRRKAGVVFLCPRGATSRA